MDVDDCKYCIRDGILMNKCRINVSDDASQDVIDRHCFQFKSSSCRCCGLIDYFEPSRHKTKKFTSKYRKK